MILGTFDYQSSRLIVPMEFLGHNFLFVSVHASTHLIHWAVAIVSFCCPSICKYVYVHKALPTGLRLTITSVVSRRSQQSAILKNTHTDQFNGPLSETAWVSRYQKGKTNLDSAEARDSEWQWHQLGHMQVCTLLQTDSHASISPLSLRLLPDSVAAAIRTQALLR